MYDIREASPVDFKELLELLKSIPQHEKVYLYHHTQINSTLNRLAKNVVEGRVVLFTHNNQIIGFLEYDIQPTPKIYIYAVYISDTHRQQTYSLLLPLFNKMKHAYKIPIEFMIDPKNRAMRVLVKFIKAEFVRLDPTGRWVYRVKEVL